MIRKKQIVGIVLAAALLLLPACGQATQTEDTTAITTETQDKRPVGTMPTVSITEINMSAPESERYREWLEIRYTQFPRQVNEPTLPKPSKRWKRNKPDDSAFNEWLVDNSGKRRLALAKSSWQTWEWNDAWEVELYNYTKGDLHRVVLRARNKITGETQNIAEIFNSYYHDVDYTRPRLLHVAETYLLYQVIRDADLVLYLYSLEQGNIYIGTDGYNWAFADRACTQLYWQSRNPDTEITELCCADLRKMAAGESGAVRIITGEHWAGHWFIDTQFSPDGRYLQTNAWDKDGKYLIICDFEAGCEVYFGQLPEMPSNTGMLLWADDKTLYYWEHIYYYNPESRLFYPASGIEKTVEQVVLYEIRCEF